MSKAKQAPKVRFLTTFVLPALLVFLVPVLSFFFFRHAQARFDSQIRESILKQIHADGSLTAGQRARAIDFFNEMPISRLMANREFASQMQRHALSLCHVSLDDLPVGRIDRGRHWRVSAGGGVCDPVLALAVRAVPQPAVRLACPAALRRPAGDRPGSSARRPVVLGHGPVDQFLLPEAHPGRRLAGGVCGGHRDRRHLPPHQQRFRGRGPGDRERPGRSHLERTATHLRPGGDRTAGSDHCRDR